MSDDPTYHPLPACCPQAPGEPSHVYGARVLAFLIETRCTATSNDHALEQAEHAAMRAVSQAGGRQADPVVLRVLTDVRHQIAGVLAWRKAEDQADPAEPTVVAAVAHDQDDGGFRAALIDAPLVNPPAGGGAVPEPEPAAAVAATARVALAPAAPAARVRPLVPEVPTGIPAGAIPLSSLIPDRAPARTVLTVPAAQTGGDHVQF